MAAFNSLLGGVLLALSLVTSGHAQGIRPTLNLFAAGGNEFTFSFVVGDGERTVSVVTNPNLSNIVSDPDSNVTRVEFAIQGGLSEEKLQYNSAPGFVATINGGLYVFSKGVPSLPSDFSFLSTVKYTANLTVSALSLLSPRNITVTAYDAVGGGPSSVIHLTLIPPTLYPPVFSASTYYTSLFQNTTVGNNLSVNVKAVDPSGWPVYYSISQQTTPNAFAIDPQTGVIRVNSSTAVNSETARFIIVTVLATDSPLTDPPKTGTATVNITLFHPPYFKQSSYTFSTPSVGQVAAVDVDGNILTYSFASPQPNFAINSATGAITITGSLTQLAYTFVVQVTDGVYTVGVNVTINVTPVVGAVITPTSSAVNILLDTKNYSVYLSSISGTPLVVQDTTADITRGTAALTAQLNGAAVSHTFNRYLCISINIS